MRGTFRTAEERAKIMKACKNLRGQALCKKLDDLNVIRSTYASWKSVYKQNKKKNKQPKFTTIEIEDKPKPSFSKIKILLSILLEEADRLERLL